MKAYLKEKDFEAVEDFTDNFKDLEVDFQLIGSATETPKYDEVDILVTGKSGDLNKAVNRVDTLAKSQNRYAIAERKDNTREFFKRYNVQVDGTQIDLRIKKSGGGFFGLFS